MNAIFSRPSVGEKTTAIGCPPSPADSKSHVACLHLERVSHDSADRKASLFGMDAGSRFVNPANLYDLGPLIRQEAWSRTVQSLPETSWCPSPPWDSSLPGAFFMRERISSGALPDSSKPAAVASEIWDSLANAAGYDGLRLGRPLRKKSVIPVVWRAAI